MRHLLLATAALLVAAPAAAQSVDPATGGALVAEGTDHSEVMTTAEYLADVIGPRMTNSPAMRTAEQWTQDKFRGWGLVDVHKEGFDFGRGWWIEKSSVRMVAPRPVQLTAIPIAWTPATNGVVTAPVIVAPMKSAGDFAQWKGKLAGKVVLVSAPGTGSEPNEPDFQRLSDADLAKLDVYQEPTWDPANQRQTLARAGFERALAQFLAEEGAVAYVTRSRNDGKLVHGEGYLHHVGETPKVPGVEMAAEDYRRLVRLAWTGKAPTLEIENNVHFDDSDPKAYNIIADIKGSDPRAGYVMAGAHLDSWVAGDGAADNGAGSAMVMEAARIIAASGIKPKRTIRFALWAGEEQSLYGSIAYIEQHLAKRPAWDHVPSADEFYYSWATRFPITPLPGHKDLAAYFNIDNGSGKIRGIYAENNMAVVPIFRDWLAPFASMGASTVAIQKTEGTDHQFMQSVGIPAFQFIQDPLDYESRVHHTQLDTYDHLKAADMRQASIILAAFLLDAANARDPLPRLPIPTAPAVTDPFTGPAKEK
ncbi:M20/M25/M40 family metallo-hydrolase [Sphingomonas sp. KR3-1]|uniref:M20/M25/M40 family metallo-hydrolase n=1 Tax=Sphingomonas sp. KR3-1 TaxID=3156611 RepID=UPI0032B5F1A2